MHVLVDRLETTRISNLNDDNNENDADTESVA